MEIVKTNGDEIRGYDNEQLAMFIAQECAKCVFISYSTIGFEIYEKSKQDAIDNLFKSYVEFLNKPFD